MSPRPGFRTLLRAVDRSILPFWVVYAGGVVFFWGDGSTHGGPGPTPLAAWLCFGWIAAGGVAATFYAAAWLRGALDGWSRRMRTIFALASVASLPPMLVGVEALYHRAHPDTVACSSAVRCAELIVASGQHDLSDARTPSAPADSDGSAPGSFVRGGAPPGGAASAASAPDGSTADPSALEGEPDGSTASANVRDGCACAPAPSALPVLTEWYASGAKKAEGSYFQRTGPAGERSVRHGHWREWDASGRLTAEGGYRGGLREGLWREWHANGRLRARGTFRRGVPGGDFHRWHPGGELALRRTARPDLALRTERWLEEQFDPEGRKLAEQMYEGGLPHGPVVRWYASGGVRERGSMANGRKDGTWTYFSDSGQPIAVEKWRAGALTLPEDQRAPMPAAPSEALAR